MAVIGIFTHADIGHNDQIFCRLAQLFDRLLHDAIIGKILRSQRVLFCRQAKQDHRQDAQFRQLLRLLR